MDLARGAPPEQQRRRTLVPAESWWELVLPWLPPPDLASVSATCKSLLHLAKAITFQRSSDASRGLEHHPIPFISSSTTTPPSQPPYSSFLYTRTPLLSLPSSAHPFSRPWGGAAAPEVKLTSGDSSSFSLLAAVAGGGDSGGCGCRGVEGCCSVGGECPCGVLRPDFSEVVTECGPGCACGPRCGNRTTQGGVAVAVEVVWDEGKGWGLHAAQGVRRREFVCEYAGRQKSLSGAKFLILLTFFFRMRWKDINPVTKSNHHNYYFELKTPSTKAAAGFRLSSSSSSSSSCGCRRERFGGGTAAAAAASEKSKAEEEGRLLTLMRLVEAEELLEYDGCNAMMCCCGGGGGGWWWWRALAAASRLLMTCVCTIESSACSDATLIYIKEPPTGKRKLVEN